MTPQEAKDYFKMRLSDTVRYANGKQTRQREAFGIAVEVLEKQIPKKPIEPYPYQCPVCEHKLGIELFCNRCGQAIDWESDEE